MFALHWMFCLCCNFISLCPSVFVSLSLSLSPIRAECLHGTRACTRVHMLCSNLSKRFDRVTQRNKVQPNLIGKWFMNARVYIVRRQRRTMHRAYKIVRRFNGRIVESGVLIFIDDFNSVWSSFPLRKSISAEKWLTPLILPFILGSFRLWIANLPRLFFERRRNDNYMTPFVRWTNTLKIQRYGRM